MKALASLVLVLSSLIVGISGPVRGDTPSIETIRKVFPAAVTARPKSGTPPVTVIEGRGETIGYVFSTAEVIGSTGYGGETIDVLAGVTVDGTITGALLRQHNEPILVIGISDDDLNAFVAGLTGLDALGSAVERRQGRGPGADAIAGATVSSAVIHDAVIRAARRVLQSRADTRDGARLTAAPYRSQSWASLLDDGEIARQLVRFSELPAELGYVSGAEDTFIDLYTTLLDPAPIGGSLLGERNHGELFSTLGVSDHAVLIAANGYYSFKGRRYRKDDLFDRIQIVQGAQTIRLHRDDYRNLERVKAEEAPEFREIGIFVLRESTGFDPTLPWRLELFVRGASQEEATRTHVVALNYKVPSRYVSAAPTKATDSVESAEPPLWRDMWRTRTWDIAGVVTLLGILTVVLVFQDRLVRYRRFRDIGRLAFLGIVLVWLGWIAGGQLSVLQVVTFAHALLQEFHWEHFLIDPVIFLLWGFVAVTLLFWGRGVYCGWLCPFGAMQELLNAGARRLGIRQLQVPFAVHERLWAIKYILFLGIFAASLHTVREAMLLAEVEPFKTAISLTFAREWPFVLYVSGLLFVGLFVERFFCRYLCPLGAALAIPARLRMFNWLRRRHQCGRECQICSERCTVQAIHPTGEINPNECIYCLECQTYYMDDHVCPPLVATRKKRERRLALANGQDVRMEDDARE